MSITDTLSPREIVSLGWDDLVAWYEKVETTVLQRLGDDVCRQVYGDKVYLRGLVEFSNRCSCDCLYCGIRRSNTKVSRFTLSLEEMEETIGRGISLGFHTFVLQSGEAASHTVDYVSALLKKVRKKYGDDFAITLSCGVYPREVYREWKKYGADRYLLRFETSDEHLFEKLCPGKTLAFRLQALEDLRREGYEVGSGFMVGLPGETVETRLGNVLLARKLGLEMVGIGPFLPHPDTPLGNGTPLPIEETLRVTALLRIFLPLANIPATTAAGTLHPRGREMMLAAGANVLMPNITPVERKKHYLLYPNKICIDEDGAECLSCLGLRVKSVGKEISMERGDSLGRRMNYALW